MKTLINREDIRNGDLIRQEVGEVAHEWRAAGGGDCWRLIDDSIFYLLDRPAPPLPTTRLSVIEAEYMGQKGRAVFAPEAVGDVCPWRFYPQGGDDNELSWVSSKELTLIKVLFDAGVDA